MNANAPFADDGVSELALRHALSNRERELVRLLRLGLALKQLPDVMGISPHTVRSYTRRIRRKTGLATMADVVRATFPKPALDPRLATYLGLHTDHLASSSVDP